MFSGVLIKVCTNDSIIQAVKILRNSNMTCSGVLQFDGCQALRESLELNSELVQRSLVLRVQLTKNTGKFSFLFCVLALCSLISVHVLLYYGSGEVRLLFVSLYFDLASNAPS